MKNEYSANLELSQNANNNDTVAIRDNKLVNIFENRGKVEEQQTEFNFKLEVLPL